ncbi:putative ABC transporter-like protein [metagenome]|uniref:Putative ABC transporter-like protein n=1 Tax=metagenome TaxID=256318 RepID=A0A2P2C2D6_9ZZZZ
MLRFELYKLVTLRSTWVGATLALALSGVLALLLTKVVGGQTDAVSGPVELVQLILRASLPVPVTVAVLAITVVRSELRDGMLRLGLLGFPVRPRVLASKAGAVVVLAVVLGSATACVALITVSFWGSLGAVPASGWLVAIGVQVLVTLGWGLAGLVVGVLVPHLGGGVAALLLVPYAVEPVVAGLLTGQPLVAGLLPFRSLTSAYDALGQSLAAGGSHGWSGLLPFTVLLAVAGAFAVHRFRGLDA